MPDIILYEDITDATASRVEREISRLKGRKVTVRINSNGGNPFSAIAIAHAVRRVGARTVVEGVAASAASLIFVAGSHRVMPETSRLMIHLAAAGIEGNAATLANGAEQLSSVDRQMATLYASCSRGKITATKAMELMAAVTWLDADAAVALGLADEVAPALAMVAKLRASASIFQKPGEGPALAPKLEHVVPGRPPRAEHTIKLA